MGHPRYTTEEIGARGREIYEERLPLQLEPENVGKYLVIDIETGDYEMDADGEAASIRARDKRPEGARYGMRIGHRAWGRIGAVLLGMSQLTGRTLFIDVVDGGEVRIAARSNG